MVISTGAPGRMCGKEEEDEEQCISELTPTQDMAELLHNTTGSHLENQIPSSREGEGWCFA